MSKTSSKSVNKTNSRNSAEVDDEDLFEDSEYASFSDGIEKGTTKRDARRKIEIYWEKKRLKELLDDFDESEFDF